MPAAAEVPSGPSHGHPPSPDPAGPRRQLRRRGPVRLRDRPTPTLARTASGKFEDRWIHLEAKPGNCPFLRGMDRFLVPVAHGEGRFLVREEWQLRGLEQTGQVVLRYVDAAGRPGAYPVN